MIRHGIPAIVFLGLAISTVAQNSASTQSSASVQAQSNASSKSATASAASNTSGSANTAGKSASITNGTAVQAVLVTPLDAKRNKPGDPVVARTVADVKQDGQVVLKKGSRLTGHVTQVEARSSANAQSSLGVVFDHAVTKAGQQMPLDLSVQAIAAAANQTSAAASDNQAVLSSAGQAGFAGSGATAPAGGGMARGVGNSVGGVGSTVNGVTNTAVQAPGNAGQTVTGTADATARAVASAGSTGGLNAAGQLTSGSTGTFNLEGLNLTSAASNGTSASIVNSTSRNVHLDSGNQMLLQVVSH